MHLRKHAYSLLILSFFLAIAVASAPGKNIMDVEHKQVAPDFPGYKGVLLIKKSFKDWNRHAEKAFSQEYKGEIRMVDAQDLASGAYRDTNKYRFLIDSERHINYGTNGKASSAGGSVMMVDRQTQQTYRTYSSSFYGKILKAYAHALEKYRGG